MRMAARHGADHIMVIRTSGRATIDGLIEGTPQGSGGVPITRKQVRATRKALDLIEDEVGRPINYHSYVSGVAGPDIAVMFAEEGVNGATRTRSTTSSTETSTWCGRLWTRRRARRSSRGANWRRSTARTTQTQPRGCLEGHAGTDGAARDQRAVQSHKVGVPKENICLSTVPPTATPGPCVYMDLPYAVALRRLFTGYRMRAQMNTKYIESSTREATVTHVLNMVISKLTSADIQSTITPDEGRKRALAHLQHRSLRHRQANAGRSRRA